MRSRPSPSSPVVASTPVGRPCRYSIQRLISSWSVVVLAGLIGRSLDSDRPQNAGGQNRVRGGDPAATRRERARSPAEAQRFAVP